MPTYVALLRGINIGPRNRIAMPALREALEEAGFADVKTHLQSGNVVLESGVKPETVRRKVEQVIEKRFGLEIAVVVRTRAELAAVVKRNPLGKIATEPKRYQVTFLSAKLPAKVVRELEEAVAPESRSWSPAARSTRGTRRRSPARGSGTSSRARRSASRARRGTGRRSRPCSSSPASYRCRASQSRVRFHESIRWPRSVQPWPSRG